MTAAWLCLSLTGCHAATEPANQSICPSSRGDFPAAACAEISGTVRDAMGRGLPGATVAVFSGTGFTQLLGSDLVADGSGVFRFTLQFMEHPSPLPETVAVLVRASATGPYPRPTPSTVYGDSVTTTMTFEAAGRQKRTSNVTLTVRLP